MTLLELFCTECWICIVSVSQHPRDRPDPHFWVYA